MRSIVIRRLSFQLRMYVELDHDLVPRKLEDINDITELPGTDKKVKTGRTNHVQKYEVTTGNIQDVFLLFEKDKLDKKEKSNAVKNQFTNRSGGSASNNKPELSRSRRALNKIWEKFVGRRDRQTDTRTDRQDQILSRSATKKEDNEETKKIDVKLCEPVIGHSEEVFYDEDFGFFSAILACYNNHWVLRTSPDDWWNVIVRTVAQAVDENGNKKRVRNFFVDHEGQKEISIMVPDLATVDYSWLFDQFSNGLRQNIKTPGYVDIMEADFTTTAPHQLISSQVMLMSSLQKYFRYYFGTYCGIPGVEMKGTEEDWEKLGQKLKSLEKLLVPVMEDIALGEWWFRSTKIILEKLLSTYKGSPDKEWWSHILSWNETYESGARNWWSGWMIDFLKAGRAQQPSDFQSGTVSVPIHIFEDGGPADDGLLVAGTVGYTVEDNPGDVGGKGKGKKIV